MGIRNVCAFNSPITAEILERLRDKCKDPSVLRRIAAIALAFIFVKTIASHKKPHLFSQLIPNRETVNTLIKNRGGLAWGFGLLIVPSQLSSTYQTIEEMTAMTKKYGATLSAFELPSGVKGVIYYPKGWEGRSRCVLYYSSNDRIVEDFFEDSPREMRALRYMPHQMVELDKCPIILFDWRGVGKSRPIRPTYASVLEDGQEVLHYALRQFDQVRIVGNSLGGGVALGSTHMHLNEHPKHLSRITGLIINDSFSTTVRTVCSLSGKLGNLAHWIGSAIGAQIDAEKSLLYLVENTAIPVVVLSQTQDPVMRVGARISEVIPHGSRVLVHETDSRGHANLSPSAKEFLREKVFFDFFIN